MVCRIHPSRNNILIDLDNAYSPFADRIQCHSSACENWGQSRLTYKPIRLELTDLRHWQVQHERQTHSMRLMPRLPRPDVSGVPQHLIQRGNDRKPCFFSDEDYARYLNDLRQIAMREHCVVHAYILMTNHAHLLITPSAAGAIGRHMQSLGRRYVRYVNDRYHRTGTLWEGR